MPSRHWLHRKCGIINGGDEIIIDFQGQPIRLPYERWLHITDPAGDHPYMLHLRAEVELTLQDPEVIIRSTRYPDTARIYHKWFVDTVVGDKWLRVAVNFLEDDNVFVMSAYANRRIIRGAELWRKAIR